MMASIPKHFERTDAGYERTACAAMIYSLHLNVMLRKTENDRSDPAIHGNIMSDDRWITGTA
jgi:hypothetical protein